MKDERKTLHEFVIEEFEINMGSKFSMDCINDVLKYSNLTNRAPKLSDFVPCDDDGNVLEIEDCSCLATNNRSHICPASCYSKYKQALSRAIFEGDWEVIDQMEQYTQIRNKELRLDVEWDADIIRITEWNKDWTNCSDGLRTTRIEELPKEITFKDGVV